MAFEVGVTPEDTGPFADSAFAPVAPAGALPVAYTSAMRDGEGGDIPAIVTLDELVVHLHALTERYTSEGSRLGYFAALYYLMTRRVAEGMVSGRFQQPERMQRLACHFASRYLSAVRRFDGDRPTPASWMVAFETAARWRPLILQHLFLGMNAHINFDLGIAAAEVAGSAGLAAARQDFDEINDVLAELMDDVQIRIGRVSPWMRLVDLAGGRTDEAIMNFSMRKARAAAWAVAESFASVDDRRRVAAERDLDARVARFAKVIVRPGVLISVASFPARLRERSRPEDVIEALSRT
ncbi:MAG: DUF5995 family protein [Dehalococcoidia bacterium]